MSIFVRGAALTDVPWLLEQLMAFDKFFGASHSLFPDAELAEATITTLVESQPFFVAESVDGPVGFIAGAIVRHPYNPDLIVLDEIFWWVAEPFRGSRAGLLLLNEFIRYGERNADWIKMTLEQESPINPTTLTRRGFRPKETAYLLEVN